MNRGTFVVIALSFIPAMKAQSSSSVLGADSIQYDQTRWELVKRKQVSFLAKGDPASVLLLKSRDVTGHGGVGQEMHDLELIVERGGGILYDFAKQGQNRSPRFFADDYLEILDVTADRVPEVLFHSGTQGASDSLTAEHILQYQKATDSIAEIAPDEFFDSGTHGLNWLILPNRAFAVIATRNWKSTTSPEDRCHYCLSPFEFVFYEWNGQKKKFTVSRRLRGNQEYHDADEALSGDSTLIRQFIQ
jgi:hypothetical protein